MLEPFQLPFVQRGLIEVLALSVGAGVLGTWVVLRGLAFFSHAVGTATFPGLVLADGIGFSASLGAFGVAVAFTASVWGLARRRSAAYDSLTALVLVGCLAAGVILASDVYHSGSNVEQLLFGSLLLVDGADIRLAIVVDGGNSRRQPAVRPPLAGNRVRRGRRAHLRGQLARRRAARA